MRLLALHLFYSLFLIVSLSAQEYQLSKPIVNLVDNGFFQDQTEVKVSFSLEGAIIRYTLDDTDPTGSSKRYKKPIKFKQSGILKVRAFKKGFIPSEMVFHQIVKVEDRIQRLEISPSSNGSYAGDGAKTLTDLKAGSLNFRDGNWLGYNEGPITINIDLGKVDQINNITLSTLMSTGSWIFPPESMEVYLSEDGDTYVKFASVMPLPLQEMESTRKVFHAIGTGLKETRFIRMIIHPLPELPDWHPGKGKPGWVFIDEVIVR